jgi:hypothetical protein
VTVEDAYTGPGEADTGSNGRPTGGTRNGHLRRLEFVSTAQMSLDARAVLVDLRLKTFHLVGDLALVVGGIAFGLAGYPLGYLVAIFGALLLVFSQIDPVQRWQVRRYYASLLGQPVTVGVDDTGLRFTNPLAASQVPWSTLTSVRSTDESVVFLRERAILGYVPVSAFRSKEDALAFVTFARERIGVERQVSRG